MSSFNKEAFNLAAPLTWFKTVWPKLRPGVAAAQKAVPVAAEAAGEAVKKPGWGSRAGHALNIGLTGLAGVSSLMQGYEGFKRLGEGDVVGGVGNIGMGGLWGLQAGLGLKGKSLTGTLMRRVKPTEIKQPLTAKGAEGAVTDLKGLGTRINRAGHYIDNPKNWMAGIGVGLGESVPLMALQSKLDDYTQNRDEEKTMRERGQAQPGQLAAHPYFNQQG